MNKEIITKLLKSTNPDDSLLGLELQYQAFKHGYTNWYKREKYNREFCKRVYFSVGLDLNSHFRNDDYRYTSIGDIKVNHWFKARLEEDFKDNTL